MIGPFDLLNTLIKKGKLSSEVIHKRSRENLSSSAAVWRSQGLVCSMYETFSVCVTYVHARVHSQNRARTTYLYFLQQFKEVKVLCALLKQTKQLYNVIKINYQKRHTKSLNQDLISLHVCEYICTYILCKYYWNIIWINHKRSLR